MDGYCLKQLLSPFYEDIDQDDLINDPPNSLFFHNKFLLWRKAVVAILFDSVAEIGIVEFILDLALLEREMNDLGNDHQFIKVYIGQNLLFDMLK